VAFKNNELLLYNTKKKKFFNITNVTSVTKALVETPSKLGFTKKDIVDILYRQGGGDEGIATLSGRRRFSRNSPKDVESLFKDMTKKWRMYEDFIMDILLFEHVFSIGTSLVGGKNTLTIVSKSNHPITLWREVLLESLKSMSLTPEEIKKVHLNGLYKTALATVLDGELEMMYFIEKTMTKKKEMILNEVGNSSDKTFDVPYRWNYAGTGAVMGASSIYEKKLQYNFPLPGGGNIVVSFDHHFKKKTTDVEFSRRSGDLNASHTVEVTGEGNAIRILSTVIEIMKEFCVQYKPKKITFSAAVTEDNQSRSRVYEKMLQRHVPSMGYRYIAGKKYGGKVKFTMERLN